MKINQYTILGGLLIVAGILMAIDGVIGLGMLYSIKVDGNMKYVVAIPEVLFGIYILYLDYKNRY